jgi:cytidylate kinase
MSALVAAVVSGLLTLIGQYFERAARVRELVLSKALEMSLQHTKILMQVADKSGEGAKLYDNVVIAERYYRWLMHLHEHGELRVEAQKYRPPA